MRENDALEQALSGAALQEQLRQNIRARKFILLAVHGCRALSSDICAFTEHLNLSQCRGDYLPFSL